jgi:hypothetical protein
MPDIVIAASLDRTPREIQNEIFDLVLRSASVTRGPDSGRGGRLELVDDEGGYEVCAAGSVRAVMPDIVIAASLDRTPREIQNEIFDLVRAHECVYEGSVCGQVTISVVDRRISRPRHDGQSLWFD